MDEALPDIDELSEPLDVAPEGAWKALVAFLGRQGFGTERFCSAPCTAQP